MDTTPLLEPAEGKSRNVVALMVQPFLSDQEFEKLPPGRKEAVDCSDVRWRIVASWFVWRQTGKGNPKQAPWNTVEFKAHRSRAEFIKALFDLCQSTFVLADVPYSDPHDWFVELVREMKQWEHDFIFSGSTVLAHKRATVDGLRTLRSKWENGHNPFINQPGQIHHYYLFHHAISELNKRRPSDAWWKSLHTDWESFKARFREYVNDLHHNNEIKGSEITDEAFRYVDVGGRKRRRKTRPIPEILLVQGFQDEMYKR